MTWEEDLLRKNPSPNENIPQIPHFLKPKYNKKETRKRRTRAE